MRRADYMGLHHKNVAEVEFAFEEGHGDNSFFYMAMPWYPTSVGDWLVAHRETPQNVMKLVRVFSEVVSGLHCLHSNGIIHGDLKPDNIMMDGTTAEAHPKLIDFKFSGLSTTATFALRIVTAPIGISSNFAPPEFSEENPQRTRESDIYSLGMTFRALLESCVNKSKDSLTSLRSTWLLALVSLMTAQTPERRPPLTSGKASVASLLESLMKILTVGATGDIGAMAPQLAEVLELTSSFEWYTIGDCCRGPSEEVTVRGKRFNQARCYAEALKYEPKLLVEWGTLAPRK